MISLIVFLRCVLTCRCTGSCCCWSIRIGSILVSQIARALTWTDRTVVRVLRQSEPAVAEVALQDRLQDGVEELVPHEQQHGHGEAGNADHPRSSPGSVDGLKMAASSDGQYCSGESKLRPEKIHLWNL